MYLDENAYKIKIEKTVVKDGLSCKKCAYEVENGFILVIEERKLPKEGEKNMGYVEPTTTIWISKENPFEAKDKKEESVKDLMTLFKDTAY